MSVATLKKEVEEKATKLVEGLWARVVAKISSAASLGSYQGQNLRSEIERLISDTFSKAYDDFDSQYKQAFYEGVRRGGVGDSFLRDNIGTYEEITRNGFDKISTRLTSDVGNILLRASLKESDESGMVKEQTLRLIGSSENAGVFRGIPALTRGVVTHEVETIEADAYLARVKEKGAQRIQELRQGTSSDKKAKSNFEKGLVPVEIKMWLHSDSVVTPRPGHVAMNGKGVIADMQFRIYGADGGTYLCDHPKDPALPIGETANCGCVVYTIVLYMTQDKADDLRARCLETGGLRDPRFAKQ